MYRALIALLAASLLPVAASAASVSIDLKGADGRPLAGAVVSVEMAGVKPPVPIGTYAVAQRDIAFEPHVLIVPLGASVSFPNRDKVRHHVYSFSKPKRFDLKLYGREDQRAVLFDKPGVVALGCNIHDSMSGFIYVTATPFAVITDAAGHAAISGVPAGAGTLRVWHPAIRAPGNALAQPASVGPGGLATTIVIRR